MKISSILYCKGFTFIELLLALMLSLFILSILSTVFMTSYSYFLSQVALNKLQTNIHLLSEIFHEDIHLAGYIGCAKLTETFPLTSINPYHFTAHDKLISTEHSIISQHASVVHNNLVQPMRSASAMYLLPAPAYSRGDILLISSCERAELFEVKKSALSNERQIITTTKPLHHLYERNAEVAPFEVNAFYINDTGRKTETGQPVWALYRSDRKGQIIELVEGVQSMEIKRESEGVRIDMTLSIPPLVKLFHMYLGF